jgi:hypothetical protein
VQRLRVAVAKAAARPLAREVSLAQTLPSCQKCADPNPGIYDFTWFTSFLAFAIAKPDRRLLCRTDAASRLRMVTVYNLLFGNLGWGVFASPVISFRNIRTARQGGAVERLESYAWTAVAFVPYGCLAALVAWSLWTALSLV